MFRLFFAHLPLHYSLVIPDGNVTVKHVTNVLVIFVSYPCNRTCKTLGFTGVDIALKLLVNLP